MATRPTAWKPLFVVAVVLLSTQAKADTAEPSAVLDLWVAPAPAILGASSLGAVVVPVGIKIEPSTWTQWSADVDATVSAGGAGPLAGNPCIGPCDEFLQVRLGVGASRQMTFPRPQFGFFAEPKLIVGLVWERGGSYDTGVPGGVTYAGGAAFIAEVGLDVGYQLTWRSLYGALVIGAAAGFCLHCGTTVEPTFPQIGYIARGSHFTWDVNPQLLRLGLHF